MYQDVIGVIGGMGSYATLDFFGRLLRAFPAEKEWDRPRILIDNRCTMPSRVLAVLEGKDRETLIDQLSDSVSSLLRAGATKIILACNTSHCFLEDIYRRVPEAKGKFVNIIEACARQLKDAGEQEITLIASEGTIQSGIFDRALNGISVVSPTGEEFLMQRRIIESVKQDKITPDAQEAFIRLINSSKTDAVVLGCTEFPVMHASLPDPGRITKRIYDPLTAAIIMLKEVCA